MAEKKRKLCPPMRLRCESDDEGITCYVELSQGRDIIGFIDSKFRDGAPQLQIANVTVEPEYRRCGVGTRLYERLMREAKRRKLQMVSDSHRSRFSEAFWQKQVKKGRAECISAPGERGHRQKLVEDGEQNTGTPVKDHWPCRRFGLKHGTMTLRGLGAIPSDPKKIEARQRKVAARLEKLFDEIRDALYVEEPDAYFDWSRTKQDAWHAKNEAKVAKLKAERDKLEEEQIELDHAAHKAKRGGKKKRKTRTRGVQLRGLEAIPSGKPMPISFGGKQSSFGFEDDAFALVAQDAPKSWGKPTYAEGEQTRIRAQYLGQCDRLRRAGGEEKWQQMMAQKEPVATDTFLERVDFSQVLDEGETAEEFLSNAKMSDSGTATYRSRWGGRPAWFLQTSGFEFIFAE